MNGIIKRFTIILGICMCLLTTAHSTVSNTTAYDQTKYPIVLVHGMAGFSSIAGVAYFYGVADRLRAQGATVLVANLSAFNDNTVRGEQLLQQLQGWAAAYGYTKFNLIAHSQGGPTARYVAGVAPGLVASITMVGSPNVLPSGNNPLAGILTNDASAVTLLGEVIGLLSEGDVLPQSPAGLLAWANNTDAFNAQFPLGAPTSPCGEGPEVDHGIHFYSVAGNQIKTNPLDPSDILLADIAQGITGPSDGLVPVCATHWGKVLRDNYPWNHLDEINQLFGLIGVGAPSPVAFYSQQANRLKLLGL